MSSSSDDEDWDDGAYMNTSDDDDDDDGDGDEAHHQRKRSIRLPRQLRKKSRSMEIAEGHTGLSPRLNRMDIVKHSPGQSSPTRIVPVPDVFFLEDGVETFSADATDPRLVAVREICNELTLRVERAALGAGMSLADPKVAAIKQQVLTRAAELEAHLSDKFGGAPFRVYRDAVFRVVSWIHSASETELRDVIEGRWSSMLSLEDASSVSSSPHRSMSQALIVINQPDVDM